jgi:hypothetical protein
LHAAAHAPQAILAACTLRAAAFTLDNGREEILDGAARALHVSHLTSLAFAPPCSTIMRADMIALALHAAVAAQPRLPESGPLSGVCVRERQTERETERERET